MIAASSVRSPRPLPLLARTLARQPATMSTRGSGVSQPVSGLLGCTPRIATSATAGRACSRPGLSRGSPNLRPDRAAARRRRGRRRSRSGTGSWPTAAHAVSRRARRRRRAGVSGPSSCRYPAREDQVHAQARVQCGQRGIGVDAGLAAGQHGQPRSGAHHARAALAPRLRIRCGWIPARSLSLR